MISVSYLTHLRNDPRPEFNGLKTLSQNRITREGHYETFSDFVLDFVGNYVFPDVQVTKFQTYGIAPNLFDESWSKPHPKFEQRFGLYRNGEYAHDAVSLLMMDIDNSNQLFPFVSLDDVEASLKALNKSYLLYTSFSHKPEHPKFRAILPLERDFTWEEIWYAYQYFNPHVNYQADGAIYDPGDHLYCPPYNSDIRCNLDGDCVFASEQDRSQPYGDRGKNKVKTVAKKLTDEELAHYTKMLESEEVSDDVSIHNPKICRASWLEDHVNLHKDQSHQNTMLSTLTRIWLRSNGNLTYGDMKLLHDQLDGLYHNYIRNKYSHDIERTIKSAMSLVASPKVENTNLNRLFRKMKKWKTI